MSEPRIEQACARLAADGIEVTVGSNGDVLVVNVHATEQSWPYTWLRVFREFLALHYCVRID